MVRRSPTRRGSAATRSAGSTFASITGRSPSVARSARASNKGLDAVRTPAVSGRFYPGTKRELERAVRELLEAVPPTSPAPARAAVAPHAGYVYSGLTAAHVFARLAIPPVVVILAPNHTGVCGARGGASLWEDGAFRTPLGDVPVDARFAAAFPEASPLVGVDPTAHARKPAVAAARTLGAARADVVHYSHSGMVTGDDAAVVGYAGVLIP